MQIADWIYCVNTLANLFINSSHYLKLNTTSEIVCRKFGQVPVLSPAAQKREYYREDR